MICGKGEGASRSRAILKFFAIHWWGSLSLRFRNKNQAAILIIISVSNASEIAARVFMVLYGMKLTRENNFMPETPRIGWSYSLWAMIAGAILFGPLILPRVWKHPVWSKRTKWIWTFVLVVLTAYLIVVLCRVFGSLQETLSVDLGLLPTTLSSLNV